MDCLLLLKRVEGKIKGMERRGKRRKQLLDDLKDCLHLLKRVEDKRDGKKRKKT